MVSLSVVLPTKLFSIPTKEKTFHFSCFHFKNTAFLSRQLIYVILFRIILTVNTNYLLNP